MSKRKAKLILPKSLINKFIKPPEFKNIVRIVDTDLPGELPVLWALTRILGVGISFANAIVKVADIDPRRLLGTLTDEEIAKLDSIIRNPIQYAIPAWLLNRRYDRETGEHIHLTGSKLTLQLKKDIERLINLGHWRGIRHSRGLKVRGQRLGRSRPRAIIHHLKR
ncbi:MAG: 30S ribosomal protein S13 [Crenarchaeota archaeon]|nr:30S ribosomal protein S13 [Thermoproteota archaeon]MCR8453819.1 30S ribosomal protein S13 [Thermoproteota archaeon]MCR8455630.1 30S ribosomal protein S13 [Thermoproteota archaeon]MCR8462632.1 30S ribosomal protein S13 [Thermoproteota archaeon]MCR8470941.1 30S ribosomal protein S13 [Thermoproteota archaeon]